MKYIITLMLLGMVWSVSYSALLKKTVQYKEGSTVLEGYLVYDDSIQGKRPGILVAHEWTGVTPYIMGRAEQIAQLGYVVFAEDIYGKGVRPKNADEAGKEAGKFLADRKLLLERASAGLNELLKNPFVDPARIAAVGYCFGGAVVLDLGRSGADLKGIVTFHGNLVTPRPEDNANIKAKVLILHGADDPYVNAKVVNDFEVSLKKTKVDWQVVLYSSTVHGFSNPNNGSDPSTGLAYNPLSDKRSWQAMKDFLNEIFPESGK